jgi:ribonuclease HII
MPDFKYEKDILSSGKKLIAGVDEVGRGALAGPIVAAAVVFADYDEIELKLAEINDSKALTPEKRIELDPMIRELAADISIGIVSVDEIDKIGIGAANIVAFKRALDGLKKCDFALIDGRKFRGFDYPYRCLEKGESKSISIAAASIIAKVYRDDLIVQLSSKYDARYNLANNKGYGCEKHCEALRELGPTEIHRQTFIKFIDEDRKPSLF